MIIATFVYAPEIRVRVAPSYGRAAGQVLDISEDLVQGVLNIRTNAVHTFSFQLQNPQRKYDGVLQPMDRIVVEMKRITWVRVFSGYLNNGPIFSVWPRVLDIQASCSLKRLQFWYWDSTSAAAVALINETLGPSPTANNVNDATPSGGPVAFDQQAGKTVVSLLSKVVGWPQEKVHIAEIPGNWYSLAQTFGDEVVQSLADYKNLIGDFNSTLAPTVSTGTIGGQGMAVNGTLQAGNYGGQNYAADQANNASIIYNVGASRGLPAKAMIIAIATAWQESTLHNLQGGDRDSAGLFQQRPSQGWGTLAQVTDPTYAAGKFYDGLVAVSGWESMAVTVAAQRVQRSAFPNAYAKWEATATAAVDALSRSPGAAAASPGATSAAMLSNQVATTLSGAAAAGPPALGTARAVASAGFSLIKRSPPGTIRYSLGGDDKYDNPNPTVLDCSSFVDWAYFHGVGRPIVPGGRSTARSLAAASRKVSVATALATKGALVFLGGSGAEHHVELSLGNGYTAAAHTDGIPLAQQVTVSAAGSSWSSAGVMPGVNYSDAATTPAAAAELTKVLSIAAATSDPNEFGPNALPGSIGAGGAGTTGDNGAQNAANAQAAAENFAVNVYTWGLQPANTYGESLAGPLAMMNDSPLLPYIAHLMAGCMRSWCSAPNGDFIAWFPDYFGLFGNAAKMNVKSIELMDFTVEWSDQEIVTHQYVVGAPQSMIDGATASVTGVGAQSGNLNWLATTKGVATMDYPGIFKVVFGEDVSDQFVSDYLRRFGGRPNMVNLPMIASWSRPEFFMALYLFLQRWANQFKANVPMTFMPELWPGMLLCLPEYDFQCYIMEVQHVFAFGKGGGFNTTAKICAPARTSKASGDIFGLLPLAGSAR